ncbi:MAG: hypothetical protein PHQ86_01865 [Dehalococcoidales bacterium]|nr:hypothetical protein [Dehalococcoidales bacterium]
MLDLLYIVTIYIFAVIGILSCLAVIIILFIFYRYDIKLNIDSGSKKPIEIKKQD